MSNLPIFDVAGGAMSAQSVRLNTVASNMANADAVTGTPDETFRAKFPLFGASPIAGKPELMGVQVLDVVESTADPVKRYEPNHPLANAEGYVFAPNVDPVSQMVDMISASRNYQANVEVFNTAKELSLATINMGR